MSGSAAKRRKMEGNNPEVKETKNDEEKSRVAILDMLECPVCLDYPRERPIYTCDNGHVTCSKCISKINGSCPTCRNAQMKPNPFVGRMADKALEDVLVPCRFACHGCNSRERINAMEHHEEYCQYREVHCPANSCNWIGSLPKMVTHVKDKGCVQINRGNESNHHFHVKVVDFNDPNMTVFHQREVCHWKPIMMLDKAVEKYLIYMTIQRNWWSSGELWYIQLRSFSSLAVLPRIKVKLQVFKSEETKDEEKFSYDGGVISNSASHQEMMEEGKYLLLTDAQLKLLKTESTLFQYHVKVTTRQ